MLDSGDGGAGVVWVCYWEDGEVGWNSGWDYCCLSVVWVDGACAAQGMTGYVLLVYMLWRDCLIGQPGRENCPQWTVLLLDGKKVLGIENGKPDITICSA